MHVRQNTDMAVTAVDLLIDTDSVWVELRLASTLQASLETSLHLPLVFA